MEKSVGVRVPHRVSNHPFPARRGWLLFWGAIPGQTHWEDGPCGMYHGPWTMYHVGNLASSAREVAKRKQGEFLKRCVFLVRKGFGVDHGPCEMYHGPWTVYHVGNLASSAREVAKREQGEFLKRRGFWVRKGFGAIPIWIDSNKEKRADGGDQRTPT